MPVRSLSCAACGAKAPTLTEDQRSFVCSYCGAQTFVDPPAPAALEPPASSRPEPDDSVRRFRRRHPQWLAVVPVLVVILVMLIVIAKVNRGPAAELADCRTFTGAASHATWKSCPSESTREIVCRSTFSLPGVPVGALPSGFDELTCDCLRDGRRTWFFSAKSAPPLESRDGAERVASASCKMW